MLSNLLFLDIETVAQYATYDEMDERLKNLWNKKAAFVKTADTIEPAELYPIKAGIYSEFGKIISIAVGYFTGSEAPLKLRVTDFSGHDECKILESFKYLVDEKLDKHQLRLCAHNGREFDFPYLCRRMLINGIKLPTVLQLEGKKPWEVPHIDTMEMWKFGDYKNYTSLDLLAAVFDIPTSKDDIDGSQVNEVYYQKNDLDRIAKYCKKDVAVTARLYLKLKGMPSLEDDNITLI